MSWFGECSKLIEIRMLRKLSTMDRFDMINDIQNGDFSDFNYYLHSDINNDTKKYDFDLDISCFDSNESYLNHLNDDEIHDLVLFNIKKWKIRNAKKYNDQNDDSVEGYDSYKGHVVGELEKLLISGIPIG